MPGWIAIVLAIAAGAFTAAQSRINGQLAARLDDAYTAATISFGSGLVILLVALAFWRPGRIGFTKVVGEIRAGRVSWWMLLGGLAGAWFVVTQGLSAGVIGVALFTVSIVAGQTVGGVVFDLVGLGPAGGGGVNPARGGG
jgi:transporter family-2 protein